MAVVVPSLVVQFTFQCIKMYRLGMSLFSIIDEISALVNVWYFPKSLQSLIRSYLDAVRLQHERDLVLIANFKLVAVDTERTIRQQQALILQQQQAILELVKKQQQGYEPVYADIDVQPHSATYCNL